MLAICILLQLDAFDSLGNELRLIEGRRHNRDEWPMAHGGIYRSEGVIPSHFSNYSVLGAEMPNCVDAGRV